VLSLPEPGSSIFLFAYGWMLNEAPSPPCRPELDLDGFRRALLRYRGSALLFFALVVLAALLVTALTTRKYQATALIQLMPRAGSEVAVEEVVRSDVGGYMESRERARTQIQIILSRSVLERVLQQYAAQGFDDYSPDADGAFALSRAMTVQPRENTQLVEIGVAHEDPERAALLANLVAEVYSSFNLVVRTDAARESQGWIETRIDAARAQLDAASTATLAFRQLHDLVDIDEEVNGITARLESLQRALGETTTKRVLLQSELDNYASLARRGEFLVLAGMFPRDPTLDSMSRERAAIVVDSADVLSRYGEQHPEHQRAVERMARVDQLLEQAVKRNVDGVRSQVRTLSRQEESIDAELKAVKAELLERQRLQQDYAELEQQEERARKLYRSLETRVSEVELQAHSELNDVRIVDPAVTPTSPSTPNLQLNLAVAMFVGFLGGVALAVVRYRFTEVEPPADGSGATPAR
jgi:succinoglycan biosynthesis transport protein ExoP